MDERHTGRVPVEHAVAIAGLVFMVVVFVLMSWTIRRGREVCREMAERLPDEYEAYGSPMPGYLAGPRRNAYMKFVMQRTYEELSDPHLPTEFAKLRDHEARQLWLMLAGFGVLGLAWVWLELLGGDGT
jgi:hypothetical protein